MKASIPDTFLTAEFHIFCILQYYLAFTY